MAHPATVPVAMFLAAVAIIVLFLVGFSVFEHDVTASRERSSQHRLIAEFDRLDAAPPASATPVNGAPVGLLDVPRLGLSGLAIVEGATLGHLREGPARASSSQLPGRPGTVVILGHRDTYGGPFRHLGQLRVGDMITIRTTSGSYAYRVSRGPEALGSAGSASYQLPTAAEVSASGGDARNVGEALILATGSVGNRIQLVVANLSQASSSGGTVASAGGSTTAVFGSVSGQRSGLLFAVLWILLMLAVAYLAQRLRTRVSPTLLIALATILTLIFTYQIYGALDRIVPGTS